MVRVGRFFLKVAKFVAVALVLYAAATYLFGIYIFGYDKSESIWRMDPNYTDKLTIHSVSFIPELPTYGEGANVDAIQIYKTKKDSSFLRYEELVRKELVFESFDKEFMSRLTAAAGDRGDPFEDCFLNSSNLSEEVLHIIAYDRMLFRYGYFQVRTCVQKESVGAIIRYLEVSETGADIGIYFSREFGNFIREINNSNKIISGSDLSPLRPEFQSPMWKFYPGDQLQ